jgi:hypothetical protein
LESFGSSLSTCSGLDLYPTDDPRYSSANDPDYDNNRINCNDAGSRICERPDDQFTFCSPTDGICKGVVFQNDCGHYAQAARNLHGASNTYAKFSRRQIVWREDCAVDPDGVYGNGDPLTVALDALLAVLVFSVLFGVVSISLTVVFFFHICTKKNGLVIYLEVTVKELFSCIAAFLILGPLIAALITVKRVATFFELAGEDECSDSLTNYTFKYLGEQLPAIYAKTTGQIVVQCIMFSATAAMLWKKHQKVKAGAKVAPEPEAPQPGQSELLMVPPPGQQMPMGSPQMVQPQQVMCQPQYEQQMQPQQGMMQPQYDQNGMPMQNQQGMMQNQQGMMQPQQGMMQPQYDQNGMPMQNQQGMMQNQQGMMQNQQGMMQPQYDQNGMPMQNQQGMMQNQQGMMQPQQGMMQPQQGMMQPQYDQQMQYDQNGMPMQYQQQGIYK